MTFPPKDPIGNHPAVDWFRKTQDMIVERTILEGQGIRVSQTERGARVSLRMEEIKQGGTLSIRRVVIIAVNEDTLDCGDIGDASTVTLIVAKPRKLQTTPWDGNSFFVPQVNTLGEETSRQITYTYLSPIARTAIDSTGNNETQTIVPAYIEENDIIYAMQVTDTGIDGVTWQDMNTDGRAWGRVA